LVESVQQFVETNNTIVIRFAVADPLALCFALQHRTDTAVSHSTLWSGNVLALEDSIPLAFNVIDTSSLVDHVGGANVLLATVPLLRSSPASSIQMESTSQKWTDEANLLRNVLSGEPTFMCCVFGVAPVPYLTQVSTRGLAQDLPTLVDFSGDNPAPVRNRIVWKIPSSGDPLVTERMGLSFDLEDLATFLFSIY
jgi:hypothetical protein